MGWIDRRHPLSAPLPRRRGFRLQRIGLPAFLFLFGTPETSDLLPRCGGGAPGTLVCYTGWELPRHHATSASDVARAAAVLPDEVSVQRRSFDYQRQAHFQDWCRLCLGTKAGWIL